MSVALITGSAGLVGSQSARHFAGLGMDIVGIDNDMRRVFFGPDASTGWVRKELERDLKAYRHYDLDIRDHEALFEVFSTFGAAIDLIIHTAAQPSHDWAARDPLVDFGVNANGTLNVLEATRRFCPDAVVIFTSTNKVYGDRPNSLPLVEHPLRWDVDISHPYHGKGIPEDMPIDGSTHSVFGASKVAADIMVQEYGRYFGLRTACFRGGCLTGPNHCGTQLHGFLAYLVRCNMTNTPYCVLGYKGKQVRDNIHSSDLVNAFEAFFRRPIPASVYNIGGGTFSNCSILEAIEISQQVTGRELRWSYVDQNRKGDHIWYISDLSRFMADYPEWLPAYDVPRIIRDIYEVNLQRWQPARELQIGAAL